MSDDNTSQNEPDIKNLREQAGKVGSLEQANSAKDREIAFLRAGVNTGTTFGQMVMSKHSGDDVTEDSVKAIVGELNKELGISTGDEEDPAPGTDPSSPEAQFAATRETLENGAPAIPEAPKPKPFDERAMDTMHEARRDGMSVIEAQEAGIGEIIRSAQAGESGAKWDENEWNATANQHGHGAEFAGLPERSYDRNIIDA